MPPMVDSFSKRDRRLCTHCRSRLSHHSNFPSIRSNNQNDPDYVDDEYDVYPENAPTERGEHDEDDERDWEGDIYFGKGIPNYEFKWGSNREKRKLYSGFRYITPSKVFRRRLFAETPDEVTDGLEGAIKQRAGQVNITDKKYNPRLKLWTLKVTSGGPTYTIKIRAPDAESKFLRGDTFWNADIEVSCSCPYWRWNGPEYHGEQNNYQKGNPRGTATPPDIQDPERDSFICKHVYKAFQEIRQMEEKQRQKR